MKKRFRLLSLILILLLICGSLAGRSFAEDIAAQPSEPQPSEPTEALPSEPTDAPSEQLPPYAYDVAAEGILSAYYYVDRANGFLLGVAPGTTGERLCKVCVPENTALSAEAPATGATLVAPYETGTLTVIVTGDLNGDGDVTITDMLMLKSALLGEALSPAEAAAGDINYDGGVTITDFLKVKSALLGLEQIRAGRPADPLEENPLLLMTPRTTVSWIADAPEGTTFVSGNDALVTVDETGAVSALDTEGSAFVYALTPEGQLFSRQLVTVLGDKMDITIDRASGTMFPGATQTLSVSFNHPFAMPVAWTSSDPETLTVSDSGEVTALKVGTASVQASLENGSTASLEISVIPPITSLEIERTLYKIKPEVTKTLKLLVEPADVEEEFLWESSDPSIVTVSNDGTVLGVAYGTADITVRGKYSGLTATCRVKVCDVKQVALTFDDGPSPYTKRLLNYLNEHDIRVTFFLVANRIPNYKEEVIREVQEGHEIGYHSYAHDMHSGLTSERITSDFLKSNAMLKELTGAEFTVWRTPGGDYNQRVLDAVELPHILWSLDTQDWKSLNANAVCSKILGARDGSIVLIHDLHRTSVQGAIMALDSMIYGDYEFVTVTELLSRDGTPPENCVNYSSGRK